MLLQNSGRAHTSFRPLTFLLVVLVALTAGCSGTSSSDRETTSSIPGKTPPQQTKLIVLAAADLTGAFSEIGRNFEEATGVEPVFSFGSSGQLSEGIINGGKADVFASASGGYVDAVLDKDLGFKDTRTVYAYGKVVIWSSEGLGTNAKDLNDLLDPKIKKIAIANPDHAPYGVAAKQAMQGAGIWDKLQPKIVLGENAKQTLSFVETGNAEVGIVPLSLVTGTNGNLASVPDDLYTPIEQTLVVLSSTKHEKAARLFATYVAGPEGQAVLKKFGFESPKAQN